MLTTIEKVIFLQEVDIFEFSSSENLSYVAAITEELELTTDQVLFEEGDISDAMFLVVDGKIELARDSDVVMIANPKDVFGTWALFDDEPRVVTAKSLENSSLLKIDKIDFFDLLADNVQITQGIFKAMVKKMRGLMNRIGI